MPVALELLAASSAGTLVSSYTRIWWLRILNWKPGGSCCGR